jgi:peptidoglycan hydrolase CwlO-like protein
MDFSTVIIALLTDRSTITSLIFGSIIIGVSFWFTYRKNTNEEKETEGNIHSSQIKSLLDQIELLSKELTQAREQLTEIHTQNIILMEQVRSSNKRIGELESLLDRRHPNKKSID